MHNERPIDRVRTALVAHRCKPRGKSALCPAHDDRSPSFEFWEDADENCAVKCYVGCTFQEIAAALGLPASAFFMDNDDKKSRMNILEKYDYTDEDDVLLSQVCRLSPRSEGFRQRRPDGNGGWIWNTKGVRPVPYRLSEVLDGVRTGRWILIAEGEKDVDRLRQLGFVATCNPGGAGKWRDEYAAVLKGGKCAVLYDNDEPGWRHGDTVVRSVYRHAEVVKAIIFPSGELPDRGDVSDWLDSGHDAIELKRLIDDTPECRPAAKVLQRATIVVDDDGVALEVIDEGTEVTALQEPPVEAEQPEDTTAAADGHHLTDVGNAGRFVSIAQGRIHYVHAWLKWIFWRDGVWCVDEGEVLTRELAKQVPRNMLHFAAARDLTKDEREQLVGWALVSESSGRIASMVRESRGTTGMLVEHEMLDADPYILNCRNGTIDLRTGTLRRHDPADLCTRQVPVAYNPNAPSELWEQCLATWQPDPEMRAYLQLEAGAATTGRHTETLSVHWGSGANGKSRFWGAITDTLGPSYAVVPHKSLLVAQKYDQHDTVYANLFRKRLAVASETDAGAKLADEKIKNLTGGDRLSGRRMREDPWEFQPSHTLILFSNHKPQVQGRDEGIWRRLRLVPWTVTIPPEDRDEHLDEKLRHEQQAILAWCVEGARRYLAEGFTTPDAVRVATDAYRAEENAAERFINESIEFTGQIGDRIRSLEISDTAEEWAHSKGLDAPSLKEIAPLLESKGCSSKQQRDGGKRSTWWRGLTWKGETA
jgi:putative DNA primase/helicase